MPLRVQEGEAHRAADHDDVGEGQKARDHADLVGDLRAAHDRHQRSAWVIEQSPQRGDLALEQPAGRARQQVRDTLRARVRAMRAPEGVVDVHVRQFSQRARKLGVVARLTGLETHVLEHQHLARLQLLAQPHDLIANDRRRQHDGGAGELAQALCERRHRETVLAPAPRPAKVRGQQQSRLARAQLFDRLQRRADASVVGNLHGAVLAAAQRHVEVDPHEHAPAAHVELLERSHRLLIGTGPSSAPPCGGLRATAAALRAATELRAGGARVAQRTLCTRSTSRLE